MNRILLGDAKELIKDIKNESVDLIFTDPVYSNLQDYQWLAEEGLRVLKNDRPLLVWGSKNRIHDYIPIFINKGYDYVAMLMYVIVANRSRLNHYGNLFLWSTPCMWFNKGLFKLHKSVPDTFISHAGLNVPKIRHKWNKNLAVHCYWTKAFSKPGDLVLDPFSGSGTILKASKKMNRRYVGFEIEEENYKMALKNLSQTDPEFLVEHIPENMSLFI